MTAQELAGDVEERAPAALLQVLAEYSTADSATLLAVLNEIVTPQQTEKWELVYLNAIPVPGSHEIEMPAFLVSWRQPCPPCAPGWQTLLIWPDPDSGLWQSQMLSYEAIDFIAENRARLARSDGKYYLALVRNACAASTMGYCESLSLYRLKDGGWRKVWPGQGPSGWNYSLAQVGFSGDGIDTIVVRNSDFQSEDPKSKLFLQNHGSLHRWFDETWRREGDRYVLMERQVESSPYNTLVEFIYALQTGGDAAQWVAGSQVLTAAEQLGLSAIDYFMAGCASWQQPSCEREGPLVLLHASQPVTITFVEQDDQFFVEGFHTRP